MSALRKLAYIFNSRQKRQFVVLFLVLFIGSLLELGGVTMIIPVVQAMTEPDKLLNSEFVRPLLRWFGVTDAQRLLLLLLGAMMVLFVVKNAYLIGMTYLQYQILWHNQLRMEKEVMSVYIHKPYSFHKTKNTAELQRTILADIGNVFTVLDNSFMLLSDLITCGMLVILLFRTSKSLTVMAVGALGLFLLAYFRVFKRRLYQYGRLGQQYGAGSVQCINQAFGGIKEIKISGCEEYFVEEYRDVRSRQISMMKRGRFFQLTPKYVLEAVCIVGVLVPLCYQILFGVQAANLFAELAVFAMAAFKLLPSVNKISSETAFILNNRASIDLIYDVMQETRAKDVEREEEALATPERGEIRLDRVSFRYEDGDKMILDQVDIAIQPGASVAFVGPSGAGKTTTADLILGIMKPSDGRITYGGIELDKLGRNWFSKIGYIPQSIYLSDDTIRNNIAFGVHAVDDAKVWKALEGAQLADFVRSSEAGLDTLIGEGGVRISGGQRQRIGIARALYHDPEIMVLDEATSALDNETEKAVMESIDCMKGRKTLIIIAHRLTTIENCDEVYEIKDGKATKIR